MRCADSIGFGGGCVPHWVALDLMKGFIGRNAHDKIAIFIQRASRMGMQHRTGCYTVLFRSNFRWVALRLHSELLIKHSLCKGFNALVAFVLHG